MLHTVVRLARLGLLVLLVGSLGACTSVEPFIAGAYQDWEEQVPPAELGTPYTVFLIGDAGGHVENESAPTLRMLQTHLQAADSNSAVVFLGDNIYCCGLPPLDSPRWVTAERRLRAQLEILQDYKGRVVFVPGNHDWNSSKPGGLARVRRQERYVEGFLDRGNTFLPDDGYPGPVEVKLADNLYLIAIDTEWWMTEQRKPYGYSGDYQLEQDGDFLLALDDMIRQRDDQNVVMVAHHPMYTNGEHGGYFSPKVHLFPLTELVDNAYVPLPVIGSIFTLFMRQQGGRQDANHFRMRALRRALSNMLAEHEGSFVYASGHEHSLQYFEKETNHFIVSGAGARPSFVARGRGATFTYSERGFSALKYYEDGSVWMEMWVVDDADPRGKLVFRTKLDNALPTEVDPQAEEPPVYVDYTDSTVTAPINADYLAGPWKRFWLGSQNRELWAIPVTAPVLDLGRKKGGLQIIKRGGGAQTTSLRLRGADGKEYVIRTLDKDPLNSIPPNLRAEAVEDLVQDQISSINPYGAYVLPQMAEAAGIYHTNPELVWVPDDPRLGIYRELFAHRMVMFEERPDDDESDRSFFGNSDDVESATKLYAELDEDNDNWVDQRMFARARLFDMLISDWDRHRGQWRWAEFDDPDGNGHYYQPIPRDRDWAFNRMNGLLPSIGAILDRKFQDFEEDYGDLKGLTFNGVKQDRRLTNELTRADWLGIADSLIAALSNEVIERAIRDLPPPVFEAAGPRMIRILKARRAQLRRVAEKYYELLTEQVDVVGSHKHERFEVQRTTDSTTVVVYKTKKEGDIVEEIYRRTFYSDETDEIRLFGQDGNDQFIVTGTGVSDIQVFMIGGTGPDVFEDRSHEGRGDRKVKIYDTYANNTLDVGPRTRVRQSSNPAINFYEPQAFQYDQAIPQIVFGSNSEDGVFIGGGIKLTRHAFRKSPFSSQQRLVGDIAGLGPAFHARYDGQFTRVFGPYDFHLTIELEAPDAIRNFYGLGNGTTLAADRSRSFYRVRLENYAVTPTLRRRLFPDSYFEFGPFVKVTRVDSDGEDNLAVTLPGIGPKALERLFDPQVFAGGQLAFNLEEVDVRVNPMQGIRWRGTTDLNIGIIETSDRFLTLASDVSLYLSPTLSPQVTLAARFGGGHIFGDFPFYRAMTLGASTNLRGFRANRYAGRSNAYANFDLRLKLLDFSMYFAKGSIGALGFTDVGRVWAGGNDSKRWHTGHGGGLWFSVFDVAVISATLGYSKEETPFNLRFGFLF